MWLSMSAVVVLMVVGSGVLAEGPRNPEAAQRLEVESITTPSSLSSSSKRAVDCAEHLMAGGTTSGVYEIYPFTCTWCGSPVLVWCDMETDGGGWTVLLNRQKQLQQLDFNRTWEEYKTGFGNPHGEYYLGNDVLHLMTNSRVYMIRMDFELSSGRQEYSYYEKFSVDTEYNSYQTTTGGSSRSWNSCFSYLGSRSFTTFDRDHDSYNGNCAAVQGGGWWYYNCNYFNPTSPYNTTISLQCSGGSDLSVTQLQLKLRPSICEKTFKTIHLNTMSCNCQGQDH